MSAKTPACSIGWPAGVDRHICESLDSTNTHALRQAPETPGPAWFLAYEQTAGKGRRARPWVSPRGNFHATLLLHPTEPASEVALRSFAAALALRDALVSLTDFPQIFTLKWPNDVLLNGGKVAGILLESAAAGQGVSHLAIGIGVNLIAAPDAALVEEGAVKPVSLLQETGLNIPPERFLTHLAAAYAGWEATFTTQGFAPLRTAWLSNAARLGEVIRARTGTTTHTGRFETIDPAGNLILNTAKGRQSIPAAEVFF
ncbi:MAG: biotin--[acetyl-CoA-carboxylase] ligase [Cypionkella sp.]